MSRLDRTAIAHLQPGESATENGLEVQRRQDGTIAYWLNVVIEGRRLHKLIGLQSQGVNRYKARSYVERIKAEARADKLALPRGRTPAFTVASAAEPYISRLQAENGRNIARKRMQLERHLCPALGEIRLRDLDASAIERYRRGRLDAGATPSTCNRELACLSHLLSKAVEWKWLGSRPCVIRREREQRQHRVALTDAQAAALMQAALADSDGYAYLFCSIGLSTGMRHSEIVAMRFDQVDFAGCRLSIPVAKAGARLQPIPVELRDLLLRERDMAQDPQGWVFPSARPELAASGHRTRMDRTFRRVVAAAGLTKVITAHSMRHTAISRLIKAGVDLPTIQRISGHRVLSMVMEYSHIDAPHIDRAVAILGQSPGASLPPAYRDGTSALEGISTPSAQVIEMRRK
jgi:integrase